eukprot:Rmarinus@m.28396
MSCSRQQRLDIGFRTLVLSERPDQKVSGVIWDSGQVLARYIASQGSVVKNKRVLELGSGTGVAGLACCFAGAKEVVLTDIDSALPLLRTNASLASHQDDHDSTTVRVAPLHWGSKEEAQDVGSPFSVVVYVLPPSGCMCGCGVSRTDFPQSYRFAL